MQSRQMRVPVWDVFVTFNGLDATIVNLSKTGALLALRRDAPVGDTNGYVSFVLDFRVYDLPVRVVREQEERPRPRNGTPLWHVAVDFAADDRHHTDEVIRQVMSTKRMTRAA